MGRPRLLLLFRSAGEELQVDHRSFIPDQGRTGQLVAGESAVLPFAGRRERLPSGLGGMEKNVRQRLPGRERIAALLPAGRSEPLERVADRRA